jgi:hypothetical protein
MTRIGLLATVLFALPTGALAQDPNLVGLIPHAQRPMVIDGRLDEWDGAFVAPVHVGHPDFANRGGQFLFLWDERNLYIGLRALDRIPIHTSTGPNEKLYDGDAVEFYLDVRRGAELGAPSYTEGTLHMFWTAFTGADVRPRLQVRDLPGFRNLRLNGVELAAQRTPWGYAAEFRMPWANFPNFAPRVGEFLALDCELCSSDGGSRVDRTFAFSSPASVSSPAAFGRVQLVDRAEGAALRPFGRALLPGAVTKSANYGWVYATIGLSPTLDRDVTRVRGRIEDILGVERKVSSGARLVTPDGQFVLWQGKWEVFDLPPGSYAVVIEALDAGGNVVVSRSIRLQLD